MTDRFPDPDDETLGRRLQGELPRYPAPPGLRARLVAAGAPVPRRSWMGPLLASVATALVLLLLIPERLPRPVGGDFEQPWVQAVVSEHTRALMWGARRWEIMPTTTGWLAEESGVGLNRVLPGDDRLSFVAAEPVYLLRTRGVAIHYRDVDGHLITYVALPVPKFTVPDRLRVPVDRYRPALVRDADGFAALVWKQGDLACFLVSDLVSSDDLERFKDYFVRLRQGVEPVY